MGKRENMWVCDHCLAAIESREGYLPTLRHDIDLEFEPDDVEKSKCDWCQEDGFDVLFELI